MNKILFLTSLLFLGLNNESNNNLVYEEVSYENIIQEENNVKLLSDKTNEYKIISQYFEAFISNINNVKMKVDNEGNVYITYLKEDDLYYRKYSASGSILEDFVILRDKIGDYTIDLLDNDLYVIGTIENYYNINSSRFDLDKKDGIIIVIEEDNNTYFKLFGGMLNESFDRFIFLENRIFIVGRKDPLSGGDFGYSGSMNNTVYVCEVNKDLDIVNYVTLDNITDILDFTYKNNNLYLITKTRIYILDQQLRLLNNSSLYNDGCFGIVGINEYIVIFFNNSKNYLTIFNNDLEEIKVLSNELNILEYKKMNNCIYGKTKDKIYKMDVFENENIIMYDNYYSGLDEITYTYSLFSKAMLIKKECNVFFDPQVYGEYEHTLTYSTSNGLEYLYTKKQKVLFECNVIENNVYPINYRILFTGKAKLNGNDIINNYCLTKEGEYTLLLTSCNDEVKKINFSVSNKQMMFIEETNKNCDLKINEENFNIKIKINNLENLMTNNNLIIKSVVIDSVEHENIKIENNYIYIAKKAEKEGIIKYKIEKIVYFINDVQNEYILNYIYVVNFMKKDLNFTISDISDDLVFSIDIEGNKLKEESLLRYLEIIFSNYHEELIYKYPLVNSTISVKGLQINTDYKMYMYIAYDIGDDVLYKKEIIQGDFISKKNNFNLGNIEYSDNMLKVDLSNEVKRNNLENLVKDGKVVYSGKIIDYKFYITLGIVMMICVFIICIIVRYSKKRKREIRISI